MHKTDIDIGPDRTTDMPVFDFQIVLLSFEAIEVILLSDCKMLSVVQVAMLSPGLAERIVALLSHDDDVAPLFALVPLPPPLPPPASVPPATAVIVVDSRREVLIAFATPA
uniref:Uncharacterized protein n=1 Tax=Glossina pallidipes TaxID=7398 RepID=A0A1A9ZQG1_GLOPL